MIVNSKRKSAKKFEHPQQSTTHKIARNLQLEFDQESFQGHTHISEESQSPHYQIQQSQQRITQNFQNNKQNEHNFNKLPRSYLLAMESLQEAIEKKNQQINELKVLLVEKEEYILGGEVRINSVLKRYEDLSQTCEKQSHEISILKSHLKEARIDQEHAIKQVARAMQNQVIPKLPQEILNANHETAQFIMNSEQKNYDKLLTSSHYDTFTEKSFMPLHSESKAKDKRIKSHYSKPTFTCDSNTKLLSDKLSLKSNSNLISYEREILRNQKQLIALNYRMECLERDLLEGKSKKGNTQRQKTSHEKNQQQNKSRIRQLRKQIEEKQSILTKLRNI